MHDLTAFQRDLLTVIKGMDNPHGLAVKEEMEMYYEGEIHHGRLYPNLDVLVDKDLLDKKAKDKRTNSYEVTGKGNETLVERNKWEQKYVAAEEVEAEL